MIFTTKFKNIFFAVIAVSIVWGALEAAAFAILYNYDIYYLMPFPLIRSDETFAGAEDVTVKLKKADLSFATWIIADEDLIWRLRPGLEMKVENMNRRAYPAEEYRYFTVTSNSRGFRTPEFDAVKKPGIFRVISIGDSNVFGWAVETKDSFCGILKGRLEPMGGEYINLGVFGYTSTQAVTLFQREVLPLKPAFLIVWLGENDNCAVTGHSDSELIRFNKTFLGRTENFCFTHSFVSRLIYKLTADLSRLAGARGASHKVMRVPLDEFERNMNYLAQGCLKNGITAIFMLHYNPFDPYQKVVAAIAGKYGYEFVPIRELYRSAAQKELSLAELPSWDYFEKDIVPQWIISGDGHPTLRGHLLIADKLYSLIRTSLQRGSSR